MSKIVWLASYPKSGNTWLRAFLANFVHPQDQPADINRLSISIGAGNRGNFDQIVGLESSGLTNAEIDSYLSGVYRRIAADAAETLYFKTHDAYLVDQEGIPRIPTDVTQCAVYIVRNPLDVAISFAHHMGRSLDATIEHMADSEFAFGRNPDRLHRQLRQPLLSWSGHVESWLSHSEFPVHLMRYEDMLNRQVETFTACIQFLGLDCDTSRIQQALKNSSFETLRGQELKHGFRERPSAAASFFRSGSAGQWLKILSEEQVLSISESHGQTMKKLGYSASDASDR